MDPVTTFTTLANLISSEFFRELLEKTSVQRRIKGSQDVARSVEKFTIALADLIGTSIRALEIADLADRAVVELSVLTDASEPSAQVPAEMALRLRASLTDLVDTEIENALSTMVNQSGVSPGDTIGGQSVSRLLDRYQIVQEKMRRVLDAYVHGSGASLLEANSLVRSLTELSYLSRNIALVILTAVETNLRKPGNVDVASAPV